MKSFLVIFCTLVTAFTVIGCASASGQEEDIDYSDQEEVKKLIESSRDDYFLVDVRTAEEYASGYIPKAVNIPVDTIGEQPPAPDKDALIIVYCRSGGRSARAKNTLEEMGYTNVHNVGGILDWTGEVVTE